MEGLQSWSLCGEGHREGGNDAITLQQEERYRGLWGIELQGRDGHRACRT